MPGIHLSPVLMFKVFFVWLKIVWLMMNFWPTSSLWPLPVTTEDTVPADLLKERARMYLLFCDLLLFGPTQAQKRVFEDIAQDMAAPRRMMRLLHGDVGAGKTFVASPLPQPGPVKPVPRWL